MCISFSSHKTCLYIRDGDPPIFHIHMSHIFFSLSFAFQTYFYDVFAEAVNFYIVKFINNLFFGLALLI